MTVGFSRIALALFVCTSAANAESSASSNPGIEASASDGLWTVLTVAPDGSWGAATESMSSRAFANAIAECQFKYRAKIGCGGYLVSAQREWILGVRCGAENILAVGRTLAEAEQFATRRESELRQSFVPDMPPCRRFVTITPQGAIVAPTISGVSTNGQPRVTNMLGGDHD